MPEGKPAGLWITHLSSSSLDWAVEVWPTKEDAEASIKTIQASRDLNVCGPYEVPEALARVLRDNPAASEAFTSLVDEIVHDAVNENYFGREEEDG